MRQIPEEFLMNRLVEQNRVTPKMMEAVSEKLVRFYSSAETSDYIESFARPERVKQDTDENFEQTEKYLQSISRTLRNHQGRTDRFRRKEDLRRIASSHRDCHEPQANISSGMRSPSSTASI
jgi:aminoglycoside phosphotransferase family enzyme